MINDKSSRTTSVVGKAIINGVAVLGVLLGSTFMTVGYFQAKSDEAKSSVPIGTPLHFPKSDASMVIGGIYTDIHKDVLIIRFKTDDESSLKLPFKATDYKIVINNEEIDATKHKTMDIAFVKLSTDGDSFLIIPKPNDSIYNIFIKNTNDINLNIDLSMNDSSDDIKIDEVNDNVDTSTLSKKLSDLDVNGALRKQSGYYDMAESEDDYQSIQDVVLFRVTLDPALKDESHEPIVLNKILLKDNKFDYESLFNALFKEAIVKELNDKLKVNSNQMLELNEKESYILKRLEANALDAEAQRELETVQGQKDELEKSKQSLISKINYYSELKYSPDLFSNVNNEAKLINKNK